MGDLTPTKLTRAMRNAALEWALASAPPGPLDDDDTNAVAVKLSTVLLGSYGPDALLMPTVVSALVEGVMLANRELSEAYTGRPVRIDELEFVEVYGQRAEEAGRIVRDLDRYLPEAVRSGSTLRCADRIRTGEGGRSAAPSADYATGMWRRLIVSRASADDPDGRMALAFTSLGVRARAELVAHVVDNRLLGRMVRDAVGSPQVDGTVNVALFELLLPNDLKRELASVENLRARGRRAHRADPVGGARRPQRRRRGGTARQAHGPRAPAAAGGAPRRTSGLVEAAGAGHRGSADRARVPPPRRRPARGRRGGRPARRSRARCRRDDGLRTRGAARRGHRRLDHRPTVGGRLPDRPHRRSRLVRGASRRRRTVGWRRHRSRRSTSRPSRSTRCAVRPTSCS